jgi:hypothetical protein
MEVKTVNLDEIKIDLNELLLLVDKNAVIFVQQGNAVYKLSTVEDKENVEQPPSSQERIAGLHAGTTWVSNDFDDALPDEFWLGEP